MGQRSADAYCSYAMDPWMYKRSIKIHRRRLREGVPTHEAKITAGPQRFSHIGDGDTKKIFVQKESWKRVDYENRLLLDKMKNIHRNGGASVGGPPPRNPKKSTRPSGAGGNAFARKQQAAKIEAENRELLKRITNADPMYSTNKLATQEHQRLKYLSNLGRYKPRPRMVSELHDAIEAGAQTSRQHYSTGYDGVDPVRRALAQVSEEEMSAIIANKRPPGLVRKAFAAMMILVSPFEITSTAEELSAVREWVEQLGGVGEWLHNLWNFNIGLVPISNAARCKKYMIEKGLDDTTLRKYNPCLANFVLWIQEVCASAAPLTSRQSSRARSERQSSTRGTPKVATDDEFSRPRNLAPLGDEEEEDKSEDSAIMPQPPEGKKRGNSGRGRKDTDQTKGEGDEDQSAGVASAEEEAATKIQAVARGKQGRKKAGAKKREGGGDAAAGAADGEAEEDGEYEDEFDDDNDGDEA